jgi:hypothetical protein
MPVTTLDQRIAADWAVASRRAQGLPDRIEDPAILARIATLAFAGEEGGGEAVA